MSFWLPSFFSSNVPEKEEKLSDIDKIELLCDRIKSTTSLGENRQSLTELKALVKDNRLEVGTRTLDLLIHLIENYSEDLEITTNSLYILLELFKITNSEDLNVPDNLESIQIQFCEILLKNSNNIKILLNLTESSHYQTRWLVLKIFTALAENQLSKLQCIFAEIHYAYSRILEFLNESREIIRNDCLILLLYLSQNDENSQKLLVFENLFEKLFKIIFKDLNEFIVINDCILIMQNVIKNNSSTQKCFIEFNFFSNVDVFFEEIQNDSLSFRSKNCIECVISMLNLCRLFVNPLNSNESSKAKDAISHTSILKICFNFAFSLEISEPLVLESVLILSDLINSRTSNIETFSTNIFINFQSDPLLKILSLSNDPKRSLPFRKSMLYLFKSFIIKNFEISKSLSTCLTDQDSKLHEITFLGFFDRDPFSTLITSVVLINIIINFSIFHPIIINLKISTNSEKSNQESCSILGKCLKIIQNPNINESNRFNILSLLVFLIYDSDEGIDQFLSLPDVCSFLLTGLKGSISSDTLLQGLFSLLIAIVLQNQNRFSNNKVISNLFSRISLQELLNFINVISKKCSGFDSFNPNQNLTYSLLYISLELSHISKKLEVFILDLQNRSKIPDLVLSKPEKKECNKKENEIIDLKKKVSEYKDLFIKYKFKFIDTNRALRMLRVDHSNLEEDYRQILRSYNDTLLLCTKQDKCIKDLEDEIKRLKIRSQNIIEHKTPLIYNESLCSGNITYDQRFEGRDESLDSPKDEPEEEINGIK